MASKRSSRYPSSLAGANAILDGGLPGLPVKRPRGIPKGSSSKNKSKEEVGGSAVKKACKSTTTGTRATKGKQQPQRKRLSMKAVNEIMKAHGVVDQDTKVVSQCLKSGILRNKVKLLKPEDDPENQYGLDQVILEDTCFLCDETLKCTVRDVLYQPDYAGTDYEDGGLEATLRCPGEECGGVYVTRICQGQPTFDNGKFHNHCTDCPGFGSCIGDYRDEHCHKCGRHYYNGGSGGKCYKCHPNFDPFNPYADDDDEDSEEDSDF